MEAPRWLKISVSVIVFCVSVSALPIYNKLVFSHKGVTKYPFPIATAFLQLSLAVFLLGAGHICWQVFRRVRGGAPRSWLFGPHLAYKLRHVGVAGFLFGLKYGVTNWGLQLVPVGVHLLLQSSDLLWTMLLARVLNEERAGVLEQVTVACSTLGSAMIVMRTVQTLDAPVVPLFVNLLTPLILALCICTLRSGAQELFRPDNRLGRPMSVVEFTIFKLAVSASTALVLAMAFEGGTPMRLAAGKAGHGSQMPLTWWRALAEEPPHGIEAIFCGGIVLLIFQVNLTWLAGLTSALTVGVVGGLKVVPQWFSDAAFKGRMDFSPLSLGGTALVLGASALYASAQWSPRQEPAFDPVAGGSVSAGRGQMLETGAAQSLLSHDTICIKPKA